MEDRAREVAEIEAVACCRKKGVSKYTPVSQSSSNQSEQARARSARETADARSGANAGKRGYFCAGAIQVISVIAESMFNFEPCPFPPYLDLRYG